MDYTVKNEDGTINWAESHKARISAGTGNAGSYSPTPQPLPNRPVASQIEPVKRIRTTEERIAWNSAVNNAVNTIGPVPSGVWGDKIVEEIKSRAQEIYKLITEGN